VFFYLPLLLKNLFYNNNEKVCDVFHERRQKNVENMTQKVNNMSTYHHIPFYLLFQAENLPKVDPKNRKLF
jgi:hypothetical protein